MMIGRPRGDYPQRHLRVSCSEKDMQDIQEAFSTSERAEILVVLAEVVRKRPMTIEEAIEIVKKAAKLEEPSQEEQK